MHRLTIILLVALIILPGCDLTAAELTKAKTAQIEAQTEQTETETQAETVESLLDILKGTIEDDRKTREALLDLLKERERKAPPWVVGLAVLILGIGGTALLVYLFKRRIVYVPMLPPGAQPAGLLEPGQWRVELPTRREVEVGRE